MSHSQFHSIDLFILRHAWLNLWDKRMLLAESTRLLSLRKKGRCLPENDLALKSQVRSEQGKSAFLIKIRNSGSPNDCLESFITSESNASSAGCPRTIYSGRSTLSSQLITIFQNLPGDVVRFSPLQNCSSHKHRVHHSRQRSIFEVPTRAVSMRESRGSVRPNRPFTNSTFIRAKNKFSGSGVALYSIHDSSRSLVSKRFQTLTVQPLPNIAAPPEDSRTVLDNGLPPS